MGAQYREAKDSVEQWDVSGQHCHLRPWAMLTSRAMSGFLALQQQGSVATKGQVEVPGLGCYLGPCRHRRLCRLPNFHLGIIGELILKERDQVTSPCPSSDAVLKRVGFMCHSGRTGVQALVALFANDQVLEM